MIAYRSTLQGGGGNSFTVTTINPVTNAKTVHQSSCAGMFKENITFNENVTIGNNVKNCYEIFDGCYPLDQNIQIPNVNGINVVRAFNRCSNLNQNIKIPDVLDNNDATGLFCGCSKLNQNIKIPDGVQVLVNTFRDCYRFNQNVMIPNTASSCSGLFAGCRNLNQPINIPESLTSAPYLFSGCTNFNQPISISGNISSLMGAFQRCESLNQSIYINSTYTGALQLSWLMQNCTEFENDIYIKSAGNSAAASNMFLYCNNSKRKNLHFNSAMNASFNGTNTAKPNCIVPFNGVVWKTMTNGFYNATYNIYCYYNYS